jgi:hypothetical protein
MKKTIFISIIMALAFSMAMAQTTNQYPGETGTINKTGYTYKYRNYVMSGGQEIEEGIEIYNADNSYLDVEWGHKDGTKMSAGEALGDYGDDYYFSYSSMTTMDLKLFIELRHFTAQEVKNMRGSNMIVEIRVDPITGRVADVYFSFMRNSAFMNIPVETFRAIELDIKDQLTITSTTAGKKFNYCPFYVSVRFYPR